MIDMDLMSPLKKYIIKRPPLGPLRNPDFLFANICFVLFVWNVFIATTFDIYISNPDEFFILYGRKILAYGILYGLCFWFILNIAFLFLLSLCKKSIRIFSLILFVIAISTWVNATFLVGKYGIFSDGRNQLSIDPFGISSLLQIVVFLLLLWVAFFFQKNLNRLASICYFVLSVSVLTFLINIILLKIKRIN